MRGPSLDETPGIGALTLGGFLAEVVERYGPNEAFVLDDALRGGETVRWTYDHLGREARRIAGGLIASGIEPGDTVGVLMGNRPEAVAALFGASLAGARVALLSTFAPAPELRSMLERAEVVHLLTQSRLKGRSFPDEVVVPMTVVGHESWDALAGAAELPSVAPDDPALVIFSSGTTSEPKGIVHDHRSPCLQFWVQARTFGRTEATRMYTALPLFWTAGLNTACGSTLAAGGCWVQQEVFEAGAALALLARERVTEPYTLPHQTSALAEHPDWEASDLSAVTCAYGKGAYARHPKVQPDPGWIMPVGYGLSETCSFVAGYPSDTPREQARVGAGRLFPGTEVRVIDGELAVGGATRMLGYLGVDPADCFDEDGLFHTGDAGHLDDDGILHFDGRLTEMIKTGGANVSPAELEVALRALPGVKLSRVVGLDDDRLDQIPVACIVVRDGEQLTSDDVTAFLRERVASYKVPKHVLFFADGEIPMTDSATKVRDDDLLVLVHERMERDGHQ